MVIPTALGIIRIFDWLSQKNADVVIATDLQNVFFDQPAPTRDFLTLLWSAREAGPGATGFGRECLAPLKDCLTKDCYYCPDGSKNLLQSALKLLGDPQPEMPSVYYTQLLSLRVLNRGSSLAKDIKIIISGAAFYEIWSDDPSGSGEPEAQAPMKGPITIPTLSPDEYKIVAVWGNRHTGEDPRVERAAFDGGRIAVYNEYEQRTGYNYVFQVSRRAANVAMVSAVLLAGVGTVLITRRRPRSRRPNDNDKGKPPHLPDPDPVE